MKVIPLSSNKSTLIDDEDFVRVNKYKWSYSGNYAHRKDSANRTVYLHRFLMNTPRGMQVDHIDGDRLNNQKSNLRNVSCVANNRNKSKSENKSSIYKGVTHDKATGTWKCNVWIGNKPVWIGRFKEERHAALAYDLWATELYEGYAKTNFKSLL